MGTWSRNETITGGRPRLAGRRHPDPLPDGGKALARRFARRSSESTTGLWDRDLHLRRCGQGLNDVMPTIGRPSCVRGSTPRPGAPRRYHAGRLPAGLHGEESAFYHSGKAREVTDFDFSLGSSSTRRRAGRRPVDGPPSSRFDRWDQDSRGQWRAYTSDRLKRAIREAAKAGARPSVCS